MIMIIIFCFEFIIVPVSRSRAAQNSTGKLFLRRNTLHSFIANERFVVDKNMHVWSAFIYSSDCVIVCIVYNNNYILLLQILLNNQMYCVVRQWSGLQIGLVFYIICWLVKMCFNYANKISLIYMFMFIN